MTDDRPQPPRPAIADAIWNMKYRLHGDDGMFVDVDLDATFRRVALALAAAEVEPDRWVAPFHEVMADLAFLPAGRIIAGAGSMRKVTLFNCFVMGRVPDDMGGIFTHLREAALTLQQGGGIGYDFSTLRPRGAPVAGVGADASGPISFMEVWDAMCRTIMSAGSRRGAMMATLAIDHPDIEEFIDAKRTPGRLTNFNLSVMVGDAFMAAVRAGADWPLKFGGREWRRVDARALWDRLLRATYDTAEPGVVFIDRINRANNISYCETIVGTNPCGEQPLPEYGACLLGSVNLARLVRRPFTTEAELDLDRLEAVVRIAVRMLDNAISVSGFPLPAQAVEAAAKRRIGLGVTGLADALAMCGLVYGSDGAVAAVETWLAALRDAAYAASADLAVEKGPFPLWRADAFAAAAFIAALPAALRARIVATGLRNALLTSIAPTGTISLFAGNVSSGIEPIFATAYRRNLLLPDGSRSVEQVEDWAFALWRHLYGEASPPATFVTATELPPAAHLRMQAAAQRYVDSAISKTINCPADISFEAFRAVYDEAYDLGCKGCTTYRPTPVRGAVLEAATPADEPHVATQPATRPETLPGTTYKLRWPDSAHALYLTINDHVDEAGRRRPFEIFINSKNMEHYAWTVALTRMISAVFRRGGDVAFVAEELQAVFDPRGGQWMEGRYVPSLLAAIGQIVERHLRAIDLWPADETPLGAASGDGRGQVCQRCGRPELVAQEGCLTCLACGASRCA
jgi:ribonucleoside-diphosphate reductase alpha chain